MRLLFAAVILTTVLAGPAAAQVGRTAGMLDPNLATEAELAAVAQVGPAVARAIVGARPFPGIVALDALLRQTLTGEQRTEVYRKVWIHLNLNTATREEILLIPGVGNRMLHEFEEYRPYKALAQFRREIGKYVDNTELDRLTGYVFVPLDLNTASDADLLTIPGVGNRMLREFKEYRPYKAAEQFRREIGKYVDAKEVARLERYLVIP